MNGLIRVDHGHLWTDSLLVSDKFEKRHDAVLRSVRNLECSDDFRAHNFVEAIYKDAQGKDRPMYRISRDGFTMLAMGFTGAAAAKWREAFIRAFNEMERHLIAKSSPEWKSVRDDSKSGYKVLNSMLEEIRAEAGKATGAHVYSNEARLVNSILTGAFKGIDRNALDKESLARLIKIQCKDTILIARGLDYAERKKELLKYAEELEIRRIGSEKQKALTDAGKQ